MKLTHLQLGIQYPEKTIAFYVEVLGMLHIDTIVEPELTTYVLQFKARGLKLELLHEKHAHGIGIYQEKRLDNYWKFSLFVSDIERIYGIMHNKRYTIGEAYQFRNIGYLSHTKDPENHQIEFIQKTFKFKGSSIAPNSTYPLLECPEFGLITIRSKDPLKSIRFYESIFEMKLYVRMYVDRGNGFTLYFLGKKELQVPNLDIDAIENREWMYQQKEIFIEIQHYWGSEYDKNFALGNTEPLGFRAMVFHISSLRTLKEKLEKAHIPMKESFTKEKYIISPDGHRITFR